MNLPNSSGASTRRCPNEGETYRLSNQFDVTQRHPVSLSKEIKLQGEKPVLVLKASCPCGWSATNTIGDESK